MRNDENNKASDELGGLVVLCTSTCLHHFGVGDGVRVGLGVFVGVPVLVTVGVTEGVVKATRRC